MSNPAPYLQTKTYAIVETAAGLVVINRRTGAVLSTLSIAGSGAVTAVSNVDGTLTVTPTTGAVVASIAEDGVTATNLGAVSDGVTIDQLGAGETLEVKAITAPLITSANYSAILGAPFVTVTNNGGAGGDGGNFGPNTPATTTAGIQEALNTKKSVWVANNSGTGQTLYSITAGIVWNAQNAQELIFAPNATIQVPNGFSGTALQIDDSATVLLGSSLIGGRIVEAGSPASLWKGLRLVSSSSNGISYCRFQDILIQYPNIGVEQVISGASGFINNNKFDFIKISNPATAGFLWTPTSGTAFATNKYTTCQVELGAAGASAVGYKLVNGNQNTFDTCAASDPAGSQKQMTIAAAANTTIIIGGDVTQSAFFTDSGGTTIVSAGGGKYAKGTGASSEVKSLNSAGANGAAIGCGSSDVNGYIKLYDGTAGAYKYYYSIAGVLTASATIPT